MGASRVPGEEVGSLPDPGRASTLDDLAECLRSLKVWAGDPSYERIKERVHVTWTAQGRPAADLVGKTTVVDCFRTGRRRLNADLVVAVVRALHPDPGYVAQWQQALRVVAGETLAASQIRVQDTLPPDLTGFVGRAAELDHIRRARERAVVGGGTVAISAIEGMAGVGKTRLAVRAAHLLAREKPFDHVLFVDLRGYHHDPAQRPADPSAVLDGFLRLLGVPGQRIPHDPPARSSMYRRLLTDTKTLVVLDNAVDERQVAPLLPRTPGCLTLITSRRVLTGLSDVTHVPVNVFGRAEALRFLETATRGTPVGHDPHAAARITRSCGHLPLALGVCAGHIRSTRGWTLTDHADRLDERHRHHRLDSGVELALNLSYQSLSPAARRLLRLLALHPGHDFEVHAAAALVGTTPAAVRPVLDDLCRDHLLQPLALGRFTFHDLVRTFAADRAGDEDPPAERRDALTRLLDHYLAAAMAATQTLHLTEPHRRPEVPQVPVPEMAGPSAAREWLDTERSTLVEISGYAAARDWPGHAISLSVILFRYLAGGYFTDAVVLHSRALHAAQRTNDPTAQANALISLGGAHTRLGRHEVAAEQFRRALDLFEHSGDEPGQARAYANLGTLAQRQGRDHQAAGHFRKALALHRRTGARTSEAGTLVSLGNIDRRLGNHARAAAHYRRAHGMFREAGVPAGEAVALHGLGNVELGTGEHLPAARHLSQALVLHRELGNAAGQAGALDSMGTLQLRCGRPGQAVRRYRKALAIFRACGDRDGEAWVLVGLGDAGRAAGEIADALTHYADALAVATEIGAQPQQVRACTGLGHAHRALGDHAAAGRYYRRSRLLRASPSASDP
jgi:tetratricopeptide (TPR) repeat protein